MVEIPLFREAEPESVLEAEPGEPLFVALLAAHVPPASVVVTADGEVVSDDHRIDPERTYEARLAEGYDVDAVRSLQGSNGTDSLYTYRRLSFGTNGEMELRSDNFDASGIESHVERLLRETIEHYELIEDGDTILLALSGGVDSTALLYGLEAIRADLPSFDVVALTVEEPWPEADETYLENAAQIARDLSVKHRVIDSETIEEAFNLREPATSIINKLSKTDHAEQTVALVDHFLTRLLERHAERESVDRIALGVHATELVAGMLNAKITGYDIGDVPIQESDGFSFVYPLSLLTKRELILYYYLKTGNLRTAELSSEWRYATDEQSLFVFLADLIQWYWPGLQYWLLERSRQRSTADSFSRCRNCAKLLPDGDLSWSSGTLCAACSLLSDLNLIDD